MAGKIINIIPQRQLIFDALYLNTTMETVLAQGVDISAWNEVTLVVRLLREHTITSTTASIQIYAQTEGRTREDPGILFASSTSLGTVTIDYNTVGPRYFLQSLGPNLGSMIRVKVKGSRGSDMSSGSTISALVNIDLSVKTA